ncbi:uncharacterized protein LOC119639574 [Glossina fuscipes]|uniref:Uncharacterized protein LOC119639574 n=1 Tax=Glossina fuscipes TaxID=7396 RepID=A0A9C5ZAM6_9MUSC|nr:uncharacterized protein LOC119639574 [Glossina fuscipes]
MTQQADDIPKWIKVELFEEVFRQTQSKYQSTRNFRISHALAPGENYTTIILKVEAEVLLKDGSTDDLSYMLKIGHSSENLPKDMKKFDVFDVENGVYKEIAPEFERMYAKVGRKICFTAKSYTLATQEDHVLLEDLGRYGFKNVKRQDCLDLEHLKSALEKLAQWHAASAVMVEQKGIFDMKYQRGMLNEDGKVLLQNMFDDTGRYLLKNVTKLEGHEEYYEEVRTFFSKFTDIFFENTRVDPKEFNVLNHGDYWSNNIMFQYGPDGSIKATLPVDFQGPRYGSPAQDLLYLIFSSARLNIKISKFDYLMKFYHQRLIENLIILNYCQPLPTLRELHQMLIKYGLWDGSIKPWNFMMKTAHDSEMLQEMMQRFDLFDVETDMYRLIIPELEQMYTQVGVNVKFSSKFYRLPDIDEPYILLEDLKCRGFKNANRLEGLDINHTKHVLHKLAQWHAASATRVAVKGPYNERYMKGYFKPEGYDAMKSMFANLTKYFMSSVPSYNDHEEYYEDLCKIEKVLVDELFKASEVNENDFNALNHGDAWCNNIMFQSDDNDNVLETYLVDYQLPKYGNIAQDLYYLLLSSTKYEIKLKEFDYLISYYHQNLVKHLQLLNYPHKLPTLKGIHMQLLKCSIWGVTTTCGIMAAVLLDPIENANLDNFLSENDVAAAFKMQMFSNPRYRKHAETLLPWLYYRGALEVSADQ